MADSTPKSYHTDPTLWLYTSLTSGSSHIISATSRMQTILKANKIEFQALDVATDEKARMLWGRRAGKRKLPGLVRFGMIVGDLEEVEEWNEYGELKENVNLPGPSKAAPPTPTPSATNTPSKASVIQAPLSPSSVVNKAPIATPNSTSAEATPESPGAAKAASNTPSVAQEPSLPASSESTLAMALRQAGFEAAKKASDAKTKARQHEVERFKAKSADPQKLNSSGPTGLPPPSGTTETKEAKQSETGTTNVDWAADNVPLTKEGKEEVASEEATEAQGKIPDSEAEQTKKAAEEEMTKAAGDASTGAAEPEVLEGMGQAEPEGEGEAATQTEPQARTTTTKESEEHSAKAIPQHIPSAKEAEQEANKAIIADEATHVHIAGSPPPHASPGMKHPKDEEDDTVTSGPTSKDKSPIEGAESTLATGSEGKLREEDTTGKVDSVETHSKTGDDDKDDSIPAVGGGSAMEPSKAEEVTKANTEQNQTGAEAEEPVFAAAKPESKAAEELLTGGRSTTVKEATPKTEKDATR